MPQIAKDWRIEGLPAYGPAEDLRKKLGLFGQFIGDWDIVDHRYPFPRQRAPGEVHFNWILDGRAVQDVWGSINPRTGRLVPWGTTIRYYDTRLGAWRSTWIAPRQGTVRRFIGRKVRSQIVLQEEDRGARTERWVFSEIRPESFRWNALKRSKGGALARDRRNENPATKGACGPTERGRSRTRSITGCEKRTGACERT